MANSKSLILGKVNYKKAGHAVASAKLAIITEGAKAFKLYGNLPSDEA